MEAVRLRSRASRRKAPGLCGKKLLDQPVQRRDQSHQAEGIEESERCQPDRQMWTIFLFHIAKVDRKLP